MTEATIPDHPLRRSCATMEEHRRLLNDDPSYVRARAEIETATRRFVEGRGAVRPGIRRIAVVVHVVWRQEDENIPDDQIRSQIDVLNQDFRAVNADIRNVPAAWKARIGDARIEFELATVDPDGNATTGITRTQTAVSAFAYEGDPVKSAATDGADPWPSGQYLNMWVCQLGGGLLGYATFPGAPAAIDGVVILHSGFGTTGTATAPFDLGRTATHEIGHWLNLFHIWGDDGTGCYGSDEVDDTPNAAGPNFGRPGFPHVTCSNGPDGDMFVNYMDYTDDAAMFMFTAGQVLRAHATLHGPRASIGSEVQPDIAYDPGCLPGRWLHSHEEDIGGVEVFRPAAYAFPPARGRTGYEFTADGRATYLGIAAADGPTQLPGHWAFEATDRISITTEDSRARPVVLRVLECTPEKLVLGR